MAFGRYPGFIDQPVVAAKLAAGATGTDLTLSGAASVGTTLGVTGASTLASLAVTGAATVGTTLSVTGASTLTGDIAAGNINMASGKVLKLDAGSSSISALQFNGSGANTGLYASGTDQLVVARLGASFIQANSNGVVIPTTFTASASTVLSSTLRLASETTQTGNYSVQSTDAIVYMNGVSLTATLPGTPSANQMLWIKNLAGTSVTVARNGKTIDGAAADDTILTLTSRLYHYDGTGWNKIGN